MDQEDISEKGRNYLQQTKHSWLYSHLFLVLKEEPLTALGSQQRGTLLSAPAVPRYGNRREGFKTQPLNNKKQRNYKPFKQFEQRIHPLHFKYCLTNYSRVWDVQWVNVRGKAASIAADSQIPLLPLPTRVKNKSTFTVSCHVQPRVS